MKDIIFKGCGTAIVTPFSPDGTINYEEFRKLLEFQISEGADSIIVCGTTGESSVLTLEEKKELIKFSVDVVNHRIPVIAGTGSNCTAFTIELCKYAQQVGVDGLLVVTPYYNKTTQLGIIEHYTKIANSVSIPIILYNVPSRTGLNITPETCFQLSKIPNIVAIKEASGNISQVAQIANLCGNNLNIYSGNDDQILPVLSIGGLGAISVLGNIFPKYTHMITKYFFEKNIDSARLLQLQALPFIQLLFCEVNPIPIKFALELNNFHVGLPRLPLVELSDSYKRKLKIEFENFKKVNL